MRATPAALTPDMLVLGRQSCYLLGRDRMVVDIPIDHPSCSKQHAVIQFRQTVKRNEFGDVSRAVKYVQQRPPPLTVQAVPHRPRVRQRVRGERARDPALALLRAAQRRHVPLWRQLARIRVPRRGRRSIGGLLDTLCLVSDAEAMHGPAMSV